MRKDLAAARTWYEKAAAQGFARATAALSDLAKVAGGDDPDEWLRLLKRAAEDGEADAQYNLAVHYVQGRLVEMDVEEGLRWARMGAQQEHVGCIGLLGQALIQGEGGHTDVDAGVALVRKAAGAGQPEAQALLARLHFEGDAGVAVDKAEALSLARRAAAAGQTEALQVMLERALELNAGLDKSFLMSRDIPQEDVADEVVMDRVRARAGPGWSGPDWGAAVPLFEEVISIGLQPAAQLRANASEPAGEHDDALVRGECAEDAATVAERADVVRKAAVMAGRALIRAAKGEGQSFGLAGDIARGARILGAEAKRAAARGEAGGDADDALETLRSFAHLREVASTVCLGCGAEANRSGPQRASVCSRCKVARVCCKACVRAGWKVHKPACTAWHAESMPEREEAA